MNGIYREFLRRGGAHERDPFLHQRLHLLAAPEVPQHRLLQAPQAQGGKLLQAPGREGEQARRHAQDSGFQGKKN